MSNGEKEIIEKVFHRTVFLFSSFSHGQSDRGKTEYNRCD